MTFYYYSRTYGKTHCFKIWQKDWKDQMTFQEFYHLWRMSQMEKK